MACPECLHHHRMPASIQSQLHQPCTASLVWAAPGDIPRCHSQCNGQAGQTMSFWEAIHQLDRGAVLLTHPNNALCIAEPGCAAAMSTWLMGRGDVGVRVMRRRVVRPLLRRRGSVHPVIQPCVRQGVNVIVHIIYQAAGRSPPRALRLAHDLLDLVHVAGTVESSLLLGQALVVEPAEARRQILQQRPGNIISSCCALGPNRQNTGAVKWPGNACTHTGCPCC